MERQIHLLNRRLDSLLVGKTQLRSDLGTKLSEWEGSAKTNDKGAFKLSSASALKPLVASTSCEDRSDSGKTCDPSNGAIMSF